MKVHTPRLRSSALSIAGIYAVIAFLWIYFSDQALFAILGDPEAFARWSVYKGFAFVAVTSVLLLFLMWRAFGAIEAAYAALKASERDLGNSRAQLSTIIQSAVDAIVTVNDQGRIILFNRAAAEMFDLDAVAVLGQPLSRYLPLDLDRDVTGYHRMEAVQATGDTVPVEIAVSRIKRPQGIMHTIILRDIRERLTQEAEIERLNRLYDALTSINQAIVSTGSREPLFQSVCRLLVERGGLAQSWIAWHEPDQRRLVPVATCGREDGFVRDILIKLDDLDHMVGQNGRAFVDGQPHICNDMSLEPDANPWRRGALERGFRASAVFPIRQGGQVLGTLNVYADAVGFFQNKERKLLNRAAEDVSFALDSLEQDRVRRHAETALRELNQTLENKVSERTRELEEITARAQAADRLKSAFLATMSHELRTPLNSIIGFTGIVLQELAGPLTGEQHKQLGMVRGSARHLLDLINDVLDLSKIEAGELRVRNEPFDLNESINRVVETVRPMAEKKGLALVAETDPALDVMCSDKRRVEQILLNLLNNAIKFTDAGSVSLKADVIDTWQRKVGADEERALRVTIRDTGIGIREDDLKRLFKPFNQIDTGLAREHDGTGLGLAICQRLADLMGGGISANSEWKKGSEFSVTLPMVLARSADALNEQTQGQNKK